MRTSLTQFLEEVSQRGSWIGGGSVAAVSAALASALLEKLLVHAQSCRRLRRIRRECVHLAERDARMFSKVIKATRGEDRSAFCRALKGAIEVPWQVFEHAQTVQLMCRRAQRKVNPRLQSDLRCAMAFAMAASTAARTLIDTNLSWLGDSRYAKQMRRRIQRATATGRRALPKV